MFLIGCLGIISSCSVPYTNSISQTSFYEPGKTEFSPVDSVFLNAILPYQEKLNQEMNEVLVTSAVVMEKGKPESKLGNFVADVCLTMAHEKYKNGDEKKIDCCVLNNGGLRNSLPAGIITRKHVFELMPFENELVVLTLPGSTVSKLIKFISESGGVPVSGLRMKISDDSFSDVLIGGKKFDTAATYKVLTSDYLANGGDAMSLFGEKLLLEPLKLKVRDALIDYMIRANSRGEILNPVTDGRISQ